jgi:hypothetical protein
MDTKYCEICKTKEAKNLTVAGNFCDSCYAELTSSFTYYLDGKEVTKEKYDRAIKGENDD